MAEKNIAENMDSLTLKNRTASVPIASIPGNLPDPTPLIHPFTSHVQIAKYLIAKLAAPTPSTFTPTALWRDLYALTGTFRTFHGNDKVYASWRMLWDKHCQSEFTLTPGSSRIMEQGDRAWIQAGFTFETQGPVEGEHTCDNAATSGTQPSKCSGIVGITYDCGWKIWMPSTILEERKEWDNPDASW